MTSFIFHCWTIFLWGQHKKYNYFELIRVKLLNWSRQYQYHWKGPSTFEEKTSYQ